MASVFAVLSAAVAFIMAHVDVILSVLLLLSEGAAMITQLLFPSNKGVSGVFVGIYKALKGLGAKKPDPLDGL